MKNFKKLLLPLLMPLTLTSCGGLKSEGAIYIVNSYQCNDNATVQQVDYLLKNKHSFPLLVHNDSCENCRVALDIINLYQESNPYTIYKLEVNTTSFDFLADKYPDIFEDRYVPQMFIISGGELTYSFSDAALDNYTNFKKEFKTHIYKTKLYNIDSLSSFEDFKNNHQNFLLFTYDSSKDEVNFNHSEVYEIAKKKKKYVVFVDKNAANTELINYFSNDQLFVSIYENGQIKTTVNYENDNDGYNILINSFFDMNTIKRSF